MARDVTNIHVVGDSGLDLHCVQNMIAPQHLVRQISNKHIRSPRASHSNDAQIAHVAPLRAICTDEKLKEVQSDVIAL